MLIKNVLSSELDEALKIVNERFDENITWNNFSQYNRDPYMSWRVTLRVRSSKHAGHRLGFKGQRMVSACWHVHGYFFEALLSINPNAVIKTRMRNESITIDKDGGNWQDFNIGSVYYPLMASNACECYNSADELKALFKSRYP